MLTLKADDLPRFMTCQGYRLMPHNAPFNVDDTDRNEGNAAHWLVEQVHSGKFTLDELVDRKAFNGVFITEEMVEHVTPYLDAIKGRGKVECDTSYADPHQRYSIRGRADHIEFEQTAATLYISDFKYGWGIIEPKNNWSLISHALGWIYSNNMQNNVAKIVFRIYQPRPHHPEGKIREWTVTPDQLGHLQNQLIGALCNPGNELQTSEHCRKCPALASCPAARKACMNAIDLSEAAFASDVDDATMAWLLDNFERAVKILEESRKAYAEKALHRIKAGGIIPGYGREIELTNRQWKTGITVETAPMLTGKDLSKKQLITPTQALKTGLSEEVINSLSERREKGSKLVRMNADQAAKKILNSK
jgi:hypothetical protein